MEKTKEIGIQCDVQPRDYIPARISSSFYLESDGPTYLYKSRTITSLIITLLIIYIAGNNFQGETLELSAKNGYMFACFAFCVYGTLYFPNTLIQRPHPAFWRLLQSWAVFYFCTIVFLIFQSPDQLQQLFKQFIDPKLGQPLPQKSYAEDCRIYTPENQESKFYNLTSSIDVFVSAHIMGWMVKMWILRDFKLAMAQSVVFELLEITFRHWLPNFWECWWDHIILDLIVCNTGGILIGWYCMRVFQMREYKWSLRSSKELSYLENLKRLFTPQLDVQEWKVFSSPKRFLAVSWFLIFMNLCDLSFFFNKYILNINTNHNIMKFRVFPLGFYSIVAAREYYTYACDSTVKRMGPNAWLMQSIVLAEWILFFKNYRGQFTESFPTYVVIGWAIAFTVFITLYIIVLTKSFKKTKSI